jgi:membrane fusion protein (multidrug efflux system)
VPDRDVVGLRPGTRARIVADAHASPIDAKVSRVSAVGDLKTRAFEAEIEVPNDDRRLLPGMIVTVSVSESVASDSVVIPQDWLVTRLSDVGVFVDEKGVARWRKLDLGDVVRDQVIIRAGLDAADRVVITGHRDLAEGDRLLVAREAICCENGRAIFNGVGPATAKTP